LEKFRLKFEELEILRTAEAIADSIWRDIGRWEPLPLEVVGRQLARAADSIGANIAEAFGRYHYGEKLQFLYYARGSLYETKYWLNRTLERGLLTEDQVKNYSSNLTRLARQLNSSLSTMRNLRTERKTGTNKIGEIMTDFNPNLMDEDVQLFSETNLEFINHIPKISSE
jgi:four helix bundle protein